MKESSVIQGGYHSLEQIMVPVGWALKTPPKGFTPGKQGGIKQLIEDLRLNAPGDRSSSTRTITQA